MTLYSVEEYAGFMLPVVNPSRNACLQVEKESRLGGWLLV